MTCRLCGASTSRRLCRQCEIEERAEERAQARAQLEAEDETEDDEGGDEDPTAFPDGGTTDIGDGEPIEACPTCGDARIRRLNPTSASSTAISDERYRFRMCGARFDSPEMRARRNSPRLSGVVKALAETSTDDLRPDGGSSVSESADCRAIDRAEAERHARQAARTLDHWSRCARLDLLKLVAEETTVTFGLQPIREGASTRRHGSSEFDNTDRADGTQFDGGRLEESTRCRDPLTEHGTMVGLGAVLYDTREPHRRPCCSKGGRCLAHVTAVFEETTNETVYFRVEDGTHTTQEWVPQDDLLASYEPAGWSVTGTKPTYLLTRDHGVEDHHDLMTDGGTLSECPRCGYELTAEILEATDGRCPYCHVDPIEYDGGDELRADGGTTAVRSACSPLRTGDIGVTDDHQARERALALLWFVLIKDWDRLEDACLSLLSTARQRRAGR